ncbi:uncharacterized protein LOC110850229 [Folsomia candida]|uniref:Uncharacterized protein n=1 Tax=Folsomia candida TaxID=158441 RepID=A0A226E9D9_FOLCA|nr:uncharacterized protein LOC110850229 [Folsomia candida]OXA53647.1 hypothetical protein Fcan01_11426 [Folsomia candida]
MHRVSKRIQPLNQEVNKTLKNQNVKMQRVTVALVILAVMGVVTASAEFREPEVYKRIKNFLPNYIGAGNYTEESKANQCYQCSPPCSSYACCAGDFPQCCSINGVCGYCCRG